MLGVLVAQAGEVVQIAGKIQGLGSQVIGLVQIVVISFLPSMTPAGNAMQQNLPLRHLLHLHRNQVTGCARNVAITFLLRMMHAGAVVLQSHLLWQPVQSNILLGMLL